MRRRAICLKKIDNQLLKYCHQGGSRRLSLVTVSLLLGQRLFLRFHYPVQGRTNKNRENENHEVHPDAEKERLQGAQYELTIRLFHKI
jgi:hypothetical protein